MLVSTEVLFRDNRGWFVSKLEVAKLATINDLANQLEDRAQALAPVKTGVLKGSIQGWALANSAVCTATAPHAMHQEFGTSQHYIFGDPDLEFFWKKAGRKWIPAQQFYKIPGLISVVDHPGHEGKYFMRQSYESVSQTAMATVRKYYAMV